jgi:hypothetical protein
MVFFLFEASGPNGGYYRLGLGCYVPPILASMVSLLTRFI